MKYSSYDIEEVIEKLMLLLKKSTKGKEFPTMVQHMVIVKRKHISRKLKIEKKIKIEKIENCENWKNENGLFKKINFIFINCCMYLYKYPVNNCKVVRVLGICKILVKSFVVQILAVLGNYNMLL